MARKKPVEESHGTPEWMATYSDLVTLLFCFFVLLYAFSKPDESKLAAIAQSLGQNASLIDWSAGDSIMESISNGIMEMPPITEAGKKDTTKDEDSKKESDEKKTDINKFAQMGEDFPTYWAENNAFKNVEVVEATDKSILFRLGDMLFDSGSDVLKPEAITVLTDIADGVKADYTDYDIYIEGHTDNRPIATARFPDNWSLSSGRAESVGRFFINECSIEPQRITAIGRGEYVPIDTNDTPEGRQKNRRVEIRIVKRVGEAEVIS